VTVIESRCLTAAEKLLQFAVDNHYSYLAANISSVSSAESAHGCRSHRIEVPVLRS